MKISVNIKPFMVPSYVIMETGPKPRQAGYAEAPKFELSELEYEELDALCVKFRADVFAKAGKEDKK